jgi:ATP-dependent Clp protease, protease subunit
MKDGWFILTGVIDSNTVHQTIAWFAEQTSNGVTNVKMYISSIGGDMDSAFRLYDFFKSLPITIETIGFGQVDSAAITVFLAGTNRSATKNCRFLVHEGKFTNTLQLAPLSVHEENLKIFKELENKSISVIANETGKNYEFINEMAKNGTILNSEKAQEIGLITNIIDKLPFNQNNPNTEIRQSDL